MRPFTTWNGVMKENSLAAMGLLAPQKLSNFMVQLLAFKNGKTLDTFLSQFPTLELDNDQEITWDVIGSDRRNIALVRALDENKTLTALDLSCEHWDATGITDGGVLYLRDALMGNKTLLSLNLSTNEKITPVGVELLMQALIYGNCALTHLGLEGIQFADACATLLGDMLKVNTTLTHLNVGEGLT